MKFSFMTSRYVPWQMRSKSVLQVDFEHGDLDFILTGSELADI